jgi:MFS family permease
MLFGFDISSMSGVIATSAYKRYFHHPQGSLQGGIVAAMAFGSFFGSLCSSFLADKYSRRSAIQFGAFIFLIGAALQSSAQNVAHLIIGRVVAGVAIGICSSIVPVYQSEIAPKEIRGRAVSLQQWAITWGILIGYFIQYGAAQADGGPNNPDQRYALLVRCA